MRLLSLGAGALAGLIRASAAKYPLAIAVVSTVAFATIAVVLAQITRAPKQEDEAQPKRR